VVRREYGEAIPLLEESLTLSEAQLGPFHPLTLQSTVKLAEMHQAVGDAATARELFGRVEQPLRHALASHGDVLGPDHPQTVEVLYDLALICHQQGNLAEARTFYGRALEILDRQTPEREKQTRDNRATLQLRLAQVLAGLGELDEAAELLTVSLGIRSEIAGVNSLSVASARCELAKVRWKQGQTLPALEQLYEALRLRESLLRETHPDVVATRELLARWQALPED
jgi:tetratricopeptide (TPR) repeat protein